MYENITLEEYASYFETRFSYESMLEWALKHNFFEEHEDLFWEAEESFFNDWYEEYEDDEEEDEDEDEEEEDF